jgi:hypothetical protein
MRSEVLTAVKMSMVVLSVVTQSGFVGEYQRFGGTYCVCLQGCSSETLLLPSLHGVTTQETTMKLNIICTDLRASYAAPEMSRRMAE